jgi:glucosamine-6-phosphate deaminase
MARAASFHVGSLEVVVEPDRESAGKTAAEFVEKTLVNTLRQKDRLRVVFAAAPSQNEMLAHLTTKTGIDWTRIDAFHMDEYLGLPAGAPQLFSSYLHTHLFSKVHFHRVFLIDGQAPDAEQECARYAALLGEAGIDLVCMGIGENGHIAFNDPPVADFADPRTVKVVRLEERCKHQQVHDGCFPSVDLVPENAITVTIPALMSAACLSIVVPGPAKAEGVRQSLEGPLSTVCPASIIRTHGCAKLYLDRDSASLLTVPGAPRNPAR